MPKLIQDTLHPAGHLIPCMALCCCIASCYLGGDIKCCKCDKVEKPETEKAKLTGPSVDIKCCHCPSPPTCCKSPSCYQFECCDFSQADCFRISVSILQSCYITVACGLRIISSLFFNRLPALHHVAVLSIAVPCREPTKFLVFWHSPALRATLKTSALVRFALLFLELDMSPMSQKVTTLLSPRKIAKRTQALPTTAPVTKARIFPQRQKACIKVGRACLHIILSWLHLHCVHYE